VTNAVSAMEIVGSYTGLQHGRAEKPFFHFAD
jgi:hypothetical protein